MAVNNYLNQKHMNILKILKKIPKSIYTKYHSFKENTYIIKNNDSNEWVYICYISNVFYHLNDTQYLGTHQNKKEAIIIAHTFHKLGYNVYVQEYSSNKKIPNLNFTVIFGLEPNFYKACQKFPQAKKIYYATGAYYEHQNKQIIDMTNYINKTYQSSLSYKRLVKSHKSIEIADSILQIGSRFTIETYPEKFQSKIFLIHQSTQINTLQQEKKYAKENEYFYMASTGNALKGLVLLIEYFHKHPELYLNVVGPIEKDFYIAIRHLLSDNIKLWGFLNVNSTQFTQIIGKCNFLIYPSGSEGGIPGAVLNSMKKGLIPIVTRWAAFNEINRYGFLLQKWDVKSIDEGITWSLSLSIETINKLSKECQRYVDRNYNITNFEKELNQYLKIILKNK